MVALSQLAALEDPPAKLAELRQQPAFLSFATDAMRVIHDLTDVAADFVTKSLKLRAQVWIYDLAFEHVSVVQFTKRVSRLKITDPPALRRSSASQAQRNR